MARRRAYLRSAVLCRPLCWPIWVRRVVIVTAPLSVLGWVALVCAAFAIDSLAPVTYAFDKLWNGKRRRLYGGGYYGYGAYRDDNRTKAERSAEESAAGIDPLIPAE